MDQKGRRCSCTSGYGTGRLHQETVAGSPGDVQHVGYQGTRRLQEEEASLDYQGNSLRCEKRTQVRKGDAGGSDGLDTRDAGEWIVEDCQFQAIQLQGVGSAAELGCSASVEQGARGVSKDLLPPRIRGDADSKVRRLDTTTEPE